MNRREFITTVGGAAAWPAIARAQQSRSPRPIGILVVGGATPGMIAPNPENPYVSALLGGLRETGWVFGKDFVTEPRGGAAMPERFPNLVTELVELKPDVIVAAGPMLPFLKRKTASIPIVRRLRTTR